jgi:exportin-1
LQILERLVNTRWKTLPEAQRQGAWLCVISVNFKFSPILGVRNFVVGITVKVASDEATMRREKTYINKLNLALVQVCHLILWRRVAFTAVSTDLKAGVAAQLANVHP